MTESNNDDKIKANCPYCDLEQWFARPEEKGLEVCRDYDCNRPIDTFANGTVEKSVLNEAEPESVTYDRPGCLGTSRFEMKTGK